MTAHDDWFYRVGEREAGPVSAQQLRQRAADGALAPADLVRGGPVADWTPASAVPGLFGVADAAIGTGRPVYPPGAEVGRQLKVEAWDAGRLHLAGDGGDRIFLLIGLACLLVGLASAVLLIRNGTFAGVWTETWNDARWPVQFARWLTLLGLGILLIVLRSAAGGFHYRFDGATRTVRRENFLRLFNRTWPANEFERVELDFVPAAQFDQFSLWLVGRDPGQRTCLTYTNADRPEAVPMVIAAREIGALLGLPVKVVGESRTASADLRDAIGRLGER